MIEAVCLSSIDRFNPDPSYGHDTEYTTLATTHSSVIDTENIRQLWLSGMGYNYDELSHFGKLCYKGDFTGLQEAVLNSNDDKRAQLLNGKETDLQVCPLLHVVFGSREYFCEESKAPFSHEICFWFLLDNGADPNNCDYANASLLMHCMGRVSRFSRKIPSYALRFAKMLLKFGANVNIPNVFGSTALHEACIAQSSEAVEMLMNNGADPTLKDNDGISPIQCCRVCPELLAIFSQNVGNSKVLLDSPKCSSCGIGGGKRCAQCLDAIYCSLECQKDDWISHKSRCREISVCHAFVELNSFSSSRVVVRNLRSSDLFKGERIPEDCSGQSFVVKIQVEISSSVSSKPEGPLMCYSFDRSVQCLIHRNHPQYDQINKLIREFGVLGLKGFFRARVDDCVVLRINTRSLHIPQPMW